MDVDECCLDTIKRKCVCKEVLGTAVDRLLCYDVLALDCESLDSVCDRCCAGSYCEACNAAFKCCDPVFENSLSGVCKSAVNVACVCKTEACLSVC